MVETWPSSVEFILLSGEKEKDEREAEKVSPNLSATITKSSEEFPFGAGAKVTAVIFLANVLL